MRGMSATQFFGVGKVSSSASPSGGTFYPVLASGHDRCERCRRGLPYAFLHLVGMDDDEPVYGCWRCYPAPVSV